MRAKRSGSISIFVLIFGVIFSVTIGGLVLVAATQFISANRSEGEDLAIGFANAGVEYYRWHLLHNLTDYTDGTGKNGPYVHEIIDPQTGIHGSFSLQITPPVSGSGIITITSEGRAEGFLGIKRTIVARYGVPSLAKYAFLLNNNMWFGTRTTIHGKIFSNGGIRMDGTHDSTVESVKLTYICGAETGCDPVATKSGIWGDGGPKELWKFPVTTVDFNSITLDFIAMKSAALSGGVYLGPSGGYGYALRFSSDGKVKVTKVISAKSDKGWSLENGCENLYQEVSGEQTVGTYKVSEKPIIFAEDNVWVSGVVKGKVAIVSARLPIELYKTNIWIDGNIIYVTRDGQNALGLVSQNDIYFALNVPTDFEVDAAMLSQKGRIIRHNYKYQGCSHLPEAVRQSLTIYGSLISNQRAYWSYGTGPNIGFGNDPTSGFVRRDITYDSNLYFGPPPYFPIQGELELISWEEK